MLRSTSAAPLVGIAAAALLAAFSPAHGAADPLLPQQVPHYDLRLQIDPASGHVRVTGTITVPPDHPHARDTIEFFLHRDLRVARFGADAALPPRIDDGEVEIRYVPDAVKLSVPAAGPPDDAVRLPFAYEGAITKELEWGVNVIGPEWVELALYFPWFPYHPDLRPFTYHLEVAAPDGYEVMAMGKPTRTTEAFTFDATSPTNDIVVVAAPELHVREVRSGGGSVRVASVHLRDAFADTIAADLSRIGALYAEWFGESGGEDVLLVASPRERGGGYARLGGLFLAGLDEGDYFERRTAYLRYLGHELAHLWWYRADTNSWEDWLNEGLAEYSALLLLRELAGPGEYADWLARKREAAAGTPPVAGLDRDGPHAEAVLYSKAPVLLSELAERIGSDRLLALARGLHEEEVRTTARFLDALERAEGRAVRDWFDGRLAAGPRGAEPAS